MPVTVLMLLQERRERCVACPRPDTGSRAEPGESPGGDGGWSVVRPKSPLC